MADAANEGRGGEVERAEDAMAKAGSPARRPYKAPQLRRLGSVRELTLGSGSDVCDNLTGGPPGPNPPGTC